MGADAYHRLGLRDGLGDTAETLLPAGFSLPPHIHHDEDEAFYLLSGRIEAQPGDQKIPA